MTTSVEAYLDRLFDLLSGSGARGRRVLLEAQAHLEEAVERAVAAGQTPEAAERDAVARFGSPEEIAEAHASAGALPLGVAFGRLFAAGWLMTGAAGAATGLVGLISLGFARAFGLSFVDASAHVEQTITWQLMAGAGALASLAAFAMARRMPALRGMTQLPNAAMVSGVGAAGFGAAGFLLLGDGLFAYAAGERAEVGAHLAEGLAGIAVGLTFLPQAWRQLRLERATSV
jgi:hypothetical protein